MVDVGSGEKLTSKQIREASGMQLPGGTGAEGGTKLVTWPWVIRKFSHITPLYCDVVKSIILYM